MAVSTLVLPTPTDTPHRLGRHQEHDEASWRFEFSGPRRGVDRDHLWTFSKPVLNQGDTNSCVGNTFAQFINTDFAAAARAKLKDSWETETKALNCYHLATIADGINTDYFPPNDNGTSGLGGAKAAQQLGWIDRYEHVFDFNTFRVAIQSQPVCVGTLWTNQMFTPEAKGLLTVGDLTPENTAGGHEYLALGISYTLRLVRFLTSWGAAFGLGGQFTMTFDDFEKLISAQGDIIVPHPIS
jgi:hypothetical protein